MCNRAFTQFESACQASDDSDWVGGVCAELMKRGKESVPLVLKLDTNKKTMLDIYYFLTAINKTKRRMNISHINAGCGWVELVFGQGW